ncbi:hypothetical protein FACS18948_3010 [Clostridia bacterium]|nr:hypothetical protein FACS18948_3010 [Clostridia bacterium]
MEKLDDPSPKRRIGIAKNRGNISGRKDQHCHDGFKERPQPGISFYGCLPEMIGLLFGLVICLFLIVIFGRG